MSSTFREQLPRTATALVGRLALLSAVALAPWWFGAVDASVQVWLFVAVGTAVVCALGVFACSPPGDRRVPRAMLPLIAALVLGCIQLLPLGPTILRAVSPHAAEIQDGPASERPAAASDLRAAVGLAGGGARQSISVYPASTRHDLAMLVLGTGAFLAGAFLFRTAASQMWLCAVLAVNGAALGLFGIVQMRTWNGKLYWQVPLSEPCAPFGPFVCRNNAAGLLCLCLAAAVGLVVWRFAKTMATTERGGVVRFFLVVARVAGVLAAVAIAGCIVAGLIVGMSRGGWVAMAGAAAITGVVVCIVQRRIAWLVPFAAIPVVGFGAALWMGLDERVESRLMTLSDLETLSHNRIPLWKNSAVAVGDFWPTGSGLGTYRYIYKSYETKPAEVFFHHVENQYLEALIEGGVIGLGLVLAAIFLVGGAVVRHLRQSPVSTAFAFGLAGTFALSAEMIHSFFDFGLYLPSNMLAFALICGAICGGATRPQGEPKSASPPAGSRELLLPLAVILGMIAATAWGGLHIHRFAMREGALADVPGTPDFADPASAEASLAASLDRVERVIAYRPDDAELHLAAAKLWTDRYRLALLAAARDVVPRKTIQESDWEMSSPGRLRSEAHRLARWGSPGELDSLRREPRIQRYLVPALRHLVSARDACPLSAKIHLRIAELAWLVQPPAADAEWIERACRLVPSYDDLWLYAGVLDLGAGRIDSAWLRWRHTLAMNAHHLRTVLALAESHAGPLEIAEKLLPDSAALLVHVAERQYAGAEYLPVREVLGRRIESLLPAPEWDEAENMYYHGVARRMQHDWAGTIAGLSRAVELRPGEPRWHYELAVELRKAGRLEDALREAETAARLDPPSSGNRRLVEEIEREGAQKEAGPR